MKSKREIISGLYISYVHLPAYVKIPKGPFYLNGCYSTNNQHADRTTFTLIMNITSYP